MTDKELLELAAKAAGVTIKYNSIGTQDARCPWNPLEDDGDALRLAIKLGISILSGTYKVVCEIIPQEDSGNIAVHEQYGSDEYAATRRAIVRSAADVGRSMV